MELVFTYVLIYFLPTLIGVLRKKANSTSIFVVNLFLGWTVIGWVVCLAWAFAQDVNRSKQG